MWAAVNVRQQVWTEEELHARYTLKIPAEYVRKGIVTLEEYEVELKGKDEKNEDKPLHKMSKDELLELAEQLGVPIPEGTHRMQVISLILKSKEDDAKQDPKLLDEDQEEAGQGQESLGL